MARTCRTHLPDDPAGPDDDRDLGALARRLDEIAEEVGWGAPPLLVGLTADGVDDAPPTASPGPAVRAGAPDDLVAGLVGFDAPDDWVALAVVVTGRAWDLDHPTDDPRPVRLVHVVDRGGDAASVVRVAGDEPHEPGADGHGRVVDVCRRCLGLATAPPPGDTVGLWALLWLDDLLGRAAAGEEIADLGAAARSHPGVRAVLEQAPELAEEATARLVRVGELQGRARSWADLRGAAAVGDWEVEGVAPEAAAWMDDGMFARWVTATFPTVDDYQRELAALLPEGLVDRLAEVLTAWGLDRAA